MEYNIYISSSGKKLYNNIKITIEGDWGCGTDRNPNKPGAIIEQRNILLIENQTRFETENDEVMRGRYKCKKPENRRENTGKNN